MTDPRTMGGEELRKASKLADKALGFNIGRLRIGDAEFRAVLDRSLELEAEQERRRKP